MFRENEHSTLRSMQTSPATPANGFDVCVRVEEEVTCVESEAVGTEGPHAWAQISIKCDLTGLEWARGGQLRNEPSVGQLRRSLLLCSGVSAMLSARSYQTSSILQRPYIHQGEARL